MSRYGRNFDAVTRTQTQTFYAPLRWKQPRKIFTCSWSDFFIEDADFWRYEAWRVINQTPHHTYQILTKRPERIQGTWMEPHVWLGTSVENNRFYRRIEQITKIQAPVHWLSIEPMLGDMADVPLDSIEWAAIGTESGPEPRATNLAWIYRVIDRCFAHNVAVFVKQLTTQGGIKIPFESWPKDLQIRQWPTIAKV